MAGEAVSHSCSPSSTLTLQFASLMARASQSSSETARQAARLQEQQSSESARIKQSELSAKERHKHETWSKVLETHNQQVVAATQPSASEKKPVVPPKPKILQPVWTRCLSKVTNGKQRSMTFKKLLKEAAKVDSSSFRMGPKVKVQPRQPVAEKPRVIEKPRSPTKTPSAPPRPMAQKPLLSRPEKLSIVERVVSSSTSRSVSPQTKAPVKKVLGKPATASSLSAKPAALMKTGRKDAKSRLRESFIPNELIPLAQGPRRDLRTIEEIQNDMWRKQGKNYPSVTGNPKEPSRKPLIQSSKSTQPPTQPKSGSTSTKKALDTPKKRAREEESDEDSFIASSDEEVVAKPEKFDYRAEIRAMFGRKGSSKAIYSDDESDMEATGFEVEREEARAARLAKLEDEEEQRREDERAREKKRRKLEGERKKSVK